ncbi:MAG: GHMP kinase, partial [Candidatus Heimdallarchaeota archaeon]
KQQITHDEYKRLFGVLKIRDITKQAATELAKTKNQNLELLGDLLTQQHHMLSKNLQVSIEKLDVLVNESIQAGALGAKLTGAGLGGCIVAFAPGKELEVAKAIEKAGGKATICEIDFDGAKKD